MGMKIYDVTVPLSKELVVYPGDPHVKINRRTKVNEEDAKYNLSRYSFGSHSGTHVDAPYHRIEGGGTVHEMSNSLPPSQRTVAFGVWEHLEQRNFVYALRFFRFTPTGSFSNIVQAKWECLDG